MTIACAAAQVLLRTAGIAFREKREALNALLAEAESLLRPFPEERERLARLVQGALCEIYVYAVYVYNSARYECI